MTTQGTRRDPDELARAFDKARDVVEWFTTLSRPAGALAEAMTEALGVIGAVLAGEDRARAGEVIEHGDLTIGVDLRRVWHGGTLVPMSAMDFDLLVALARKSGRPVTYEELIGALWADPLRPPKRARKTIHVSVSNLRGKIGNDAILNVRTAGYMLREAKPHPGARGAPQCAASIGARIPSPGREAFAAALTALEQAGELIRTDPPAAIGFLADGLASLVQAIDVAITARAARATAPQADDRAGAAALKSARGAPERARSLIDDDPREAIVVLATGLAAALRAGARLRSIPRRLRVLGEVTVDLVEETVMRNGRSVHLGPAEFSLLALLVEDPGRVYTKRALHEAISLGPETVRTYLSKLRRKLGDDIIENVHGFGYRSRLEEPDMPGRAG